MNDWHDDSLCRRLAIKVIIGDKKEIMAYKRGEDAATIFTPDEYLDFVVGILK